jgi:hypothetical protein
MSGTLPLSVIRVMQFNLNNIVPLCEQPLTKPAGQVVFLFCGSRRLFCLLCTTKSAVLLNSTDDSSIHAVTCS